MSEKPCLKSYSERDVSRREFIKFCSLAAATLALPSSMIPRIAEALEKGKKPVLVWLEFQDCAGDTESTLRAVRPTLAQLVLDIFSLEYHETVMAAAGHQSEKSLADVVKNQKGRYITVVEGAIPLKDGGIYCTIGGRAAVDIAKEVCGNALATIAVGNCAAFGGVAAARPNPTGAVGVQDAVTGITLVNLPGCPMNVENLTATIIHYLTFGSFPAVDSLRRPLFAYGKRIHDNCERRAHFDAGQFVRNWGDEGHRIGWCLYEMGCKGPMAYQNCPTVKWNGGTSWPIQGGHGCIACASPNNWDAAYPFYRRLPNVPGANVQVTADKIGVGIVAATLAGISAHLVGREIKKAVTRRRPSGGKEGKGEEKMNGIQEKKEHPQW